MPLRALWLNSTSRPMAATLHAFKGYPEAALEHRPKHARAIWARAVTSVVVDDSDVEWQPMSLRARQWPCMGSLGSAGGIAMMVGGRGAPLLAAWLGPDWMRTPGWAPS